MLIMYDSFSRAFSIQRAWASSAFALSPLSFEWLWLPLRFVVAFGPLSGDRRGRPKAEIRLLSAIAAL